MNTAVTEPVAQTRTFDLRSAALREVNAHLHRETPGAVRIEHPDGAHNIAVGLDGPWRVDVFGHTGYYCAGMNQHAEVTVHGNAGPGVAENMMSGRVNVKGYASTAAGASGHGGLLVIDGDASLRCGISMKGIDIVVGGSVGSFSAFMAQAGRLVVCGDAGDALGDSLYEAVIYVRGAIKSLGASKTPSADAQDEPMTPADIEAVAGLLAAAGLTHDPATFQRVASARALYHWHADADQEY